MARAREFHLKINFQLIVPKKHTHTHKNNTMRIGIQNGKRKSVARSSVSRQINGFASRTIFYDKWCSIWATVAFIKISFMTLHFHMNKLLLNSFCAFVSVCASIISQQSREYQLKWLWVNDRTVFDVIAVVMFVEQIKKTHPIHLLKRNGFVFFLFLFQIILLINHFIFNFKQFRDTKEKKKIWHSFSIESISLFTSTL